MQSYQNFGKETAVIVRHYAKLISFIPYLDYNNVKQYYIKNPTGNRLEKLSGNLLDKYSIRINDQWRIIFSWKEKNAYEVEITDYHKG